MDLPSVVERLVVMLPPGHHRSDVMFVVEAMPLEVFNDIRQKLATGRYVGCAVLQRQPKQKTLQEAVFCIPA